MKDKVQILLALELYRFNFHVEELATTVASSVVFSLNH